MGATGASPPPALNPKPRAPVKQVFGGRSPESTGRHDGAYVFTVGANGDSVGAYFQGGRDFVAHPSPREAVATYQRLVASGWTPMDAADIEATAGVVIGPETELRAVAKGAGMCAVM